VLSDAIHQMTSALAAVAVGRDVTKLVAQNEPRRVDGRAAGYNDKRRIQRQLERQRGRQRLDATSDPDTHQPAAAQHQRRHGKTAEQAHHVQLGAKDSIYPPSPPQTPTAKPAERPKSLDLHRSSSQPRPPPTADQPEVVASTSGMASRRLSPGASDQTESFVAVHGRCQLKVSHIPGSEARAEPMNCRRYVSTAGQSQTPDSGVGVSPLDSAGVQSPTAVSPELILQASLSGVEYRIARTPNKSTIVIIGGGSSESSLHRAGSQPSQTTTPSTPSPVRDDQMPVPFPPVVVQPIARTGPTVSNQPVNVTAATSKFVVTDATTTTAVPVGPSHRPFPSTSHDEKTRVRLNSGGNQPRYVVTAGALTTIAEPAAEKSVPPADHTAVESVEHKLTKVSSTSPAHRQNDVELDVASRQAVINPPLVPAQTPAPADRIITPSKPKASTTVAKQRDAKSTAVAKQRQPTAAQKRAPVNGKGQSGQRSKQSQMIAKKSENRSQVPAKLTHSGNKRQDSGVAQRSSEESQPVKLSVAELRAIFQH